MSSVLMPSVNEGHLCRVKDLRVNRIKANVMDCQCDVETEEPVSKVDPFGIS